MATSASGGNASLLEPVLRRRSLERLPQNRAPLSVDASDRRAQVRATPRERLQLHPDLGIARLEVGLLEPPRRAPLVDERHVRLVHLPLALHEPGGEALEHLDEELVHRTEVVVDETLIGPGLSRQPARADPSVPDLDQQTLGRVEKGLGSGRPRLVAGV